MDDASTTSSLLTHDVAADAMTSQWLNSSVMGNISTSSSSPSSPPLQNVSASTLEVASGVANVADPPQGCLVINFSLMSPWSHPEDLVSRETQYDINTFVNVVMLTILFFVCVPTNLVSMVVFWRHGLKERINVCLFWLSFADLIIVLGHFQWNLDGLYSKLTGQPHNMLVMKNSVNNMVHSLAGFIYVSGFMTTLIAIERCLCIVWPLKAQQMFQTRTTVIIVVTATVVIMAGHYVIATRWEVVCMYDPLIRQSVDAFYSSQFYLSNKALVDIFEAVIFGILLPGVYVSATLLATVVTVVKLQQMAAWRNQSSSTSSSAATAATAATTTTTSANNGTSGSGSSVSKDVTLTRMLIGASCLFIGCNTPPLIFHTLLPFVPELGLSGKYYNTYQALINMQQLLTYVNSTVNFFVYYFFGTKFRHTVQMMFCKARVQAKLAAKKAALYGHSTGVSTVSKGYATTNTDDTG